MPSLRALNAALADAGIGGAEVFKAAGVYYLVGTPFTNVPDTCLHAVRLDQLAPEEVVREARQRIADATND
jgi:hypothetical protein